VGSTKARRPPAGPDEPLRPLAVDPAPGETATRLTAVVAPPEREPAVQPNRRRILGAALKEFAARGYDGATTAGVARRAGVTQPLVHYYFDSKSVLWQAAMTHIIGEMKNSFGTDLNELSDLSPVDQLKVLVRRFVYFSAAHPEFGCILSFEGAVGGPRLEWLLEQQSNVQLALVAQLISDGQAEGWIKPLPLDHLVTCLGAAAGYIFVVRATMAHLYEMDVDDPETVERHADTIVELFFNGMLQTPAEPVAVS
jgi:TetR/AcrR family transcriptional regulator